MIPLDLLFALSPSILLAGLWLADWRRARPGRLNRQELLKLVADASRRAMRRSDDRACRSASSRRDASLQQAFRVRRLG